jgi:hypothetical protein
MAAATGEAGRDELDPELLALPDPPHRARTFTVAVLILASIAALSMVVTLRHDVTYAFRDATPLDVGDLRTVDDAALASAENRYVRAEGLIGATGIRYERPFVEDTFRTVLVAGRGDLWVDVRVPAGQESGRWQPPSTFAGRLVRLGAAGPRHRGLAGAIEENAHLGSARAIGRAWLLIDGEQPESARWSVVLAVMFLGFAAWNFGAVARILRKVK